MMKPGQAIGWLGGHVVAPGVGGLEAEDLAGAVDGEQGSELAYVAGQRDTGEDLGQQLRRRAIHDGVCRHCVGATMGSSRSVGEQQCKSYFPMAPRSLFTM
jgi:hypothetical protein